MTYLVFILAFGLISTILNSDIPFGAMIQNWENYDLEVLLEYLNLGLGFLAFGFLFFFLIFRSGRDEKVDNLIRDWDESREDQ